MASPNRQETGDARKAYAGTPSNAWAGQEIALEGPGATAAGRSRSDRLRDLGVSPEMKARTEVPKTRDAARNVAIVLHSASGCGRTLRHGTIRSRPSRSDYPCSRARFGDGGVPRARSRMALRRRRGARALGNDQREIRSVRERTCAVSN